MSTEESTDLPDQPSNGQTVITPLGGNGFVAPIHRVNAESTVSGDASGGTSRVEFVLDKRHSYILNWAYLNSTDPGANDPAVVSIGMRNNISYADSVTLIYTAWSGTPRARLIWSPPSTIILAGNDLNSDQPTIAASVQNVNGKNFTLGIEILAFDIEAPRRVPYSYLVANRPF